MKTENIETILLGKAITAPVLIPVVHASTPTCINEPFMVNGEAYGVTCVSFGTPHGAVFVDDVDGMDVAGVGAALGTHVLFPKGASIVFVEATGKDTLKARLWQRDNGKESFTPEAASVAAAAAIMLQKIMKYEAYVTMGGQTVYVRWDRSSDNVSVTNTAQWVEAAG